MPSKAAGRVRASKRRAARPSTRSAMRAKAARVIRAVRANARITRGKPE